MRVRTDCLMPRANNARGKVFGALPRTPARGIPPRTPARFPFCPMFQNGPRRQGFASPRKTGAPLTPPGPSEDLPNEKGKRATAKPSHSAALVGLPLVGPELLNPFGVDKPS
jgi:hypothetical protein